MTDYFNTAQETSPHREIEQNIFIGDADYPEELCNVILFFALVYNDLKFIQVNISMLNESMDLAKEKPRRILGEIGGFYLYIHRLNVGLIFALQEKIKENKDVFHSFLFKSILKKLDKKNLRSWNNLYESSLSDQLKNASNPFFMIRNKTIFHYDLKEIMSGYKQKFSNDQKPCVSFGKTMRQTRFYFADAAVEGYFLKKSGGDINSLFKKIATVNQDLVLTLGEMTNLFISMRENYFKVRQH